MKQLVLALVVSASLALSGCGYLFPADNRARGAVEAMNLTDVKLTRTLIGLSCSKSDHIYYKFTALNMQGRQIRGVVCMSYMKGATVRITG
jgi:hypothetical protein